MLTRFFSVFSKFRTLKTHGRLMWHAFRHADTPLWIKGFMLAVVAYLFSPIDLLPDFLVLLGITDDLIVISAAMWFLGKVIPDRVRHSLPAAPIQHHPVRTSARRSMLKILGLVLLLGVLVAALFNHDVVQQGLIGIGSFFKGAQ